MIENTIHMPDAAAVVRQLSAFELSVNEVAPGSSVALLVLQKNGQTARLDVVDGKLDVTGDLPLTEAAALLFEHTAGIIVAYMDMRARLFGGAPVPPV